MTRLHALLLFLAFAVSTTANAQSTPVVSVVPVVARAHQDEMGVRQRAQFVQDRCFDQDLAEVNSRSEKEWEAPHLEFKQMVNLICKNPDKKRAASPSPVGGDDKAITLAQYQQRGKRRLSPLEQRQLEKLLDVKSEETLGPRSRNSRGYIGDKPGRMAVPVGCTERLVPNRKSGRMFVRVDCP